MSTARSIWVLLCVFCLAAGASAQFMSKAEIKAETTKIAALEKSYKAAKTASVKTPKDAKKRAAYLKATNAYAYKVMTAASLAPRDKYPVALRLYRESQKVSPADKDSKKWIKGIEDIYRSMGRPIPK